jgi:hypothetical protein
MASARQIAANRRNARKSTGPRSGAGKNRAGRNAYRHGLSLRLPSGAAVARQLDQLARKIAGGAQDPMILDLARTAAEAVLDLARIRRTRIAMIECVSVFGAIEPPPLFSSMREVNAFLRQGVVPAPPDPVATMPTDEPARTAEAIRRALPDLRKLDRYERRAAARRDRAVREIIKSKTQKVGN